MFQSLWIVVATAAAAAALTVSAVCPPGSHITDGNCVPCPKGSYSQDADGEYCLKCPRGTYEDREGSTKCKKCPYNHFTYFDMAESESDCVGPKLVIKKKSGQQTYLFRSSTPVSMNPGEGSVSVVSGVWTVTKSDGFTTTLTEGDSLPGLELSEITRLDAKINNVFCYTGKGEDYEGTADRTVHGTKCLNWNDVHSHPNYNPGHNYCRSWGKGHKEPYCFVEGDLEQRAVPCTVPKCVWDVECKSDDSGSSYVGGLSTTVNGYYCMNWDATYPHPHSYDVGNHNHCRNPDGSDDIWCFTTQLFIRWDYCSVRKCERMESKYDFTSSSY